MFRVEESQVKPQELGYVVDMLGDDLQLSFVVKVEKQTVDLPLPGLFLLPLRSNIALQ